MEHPPSPDTPATASTPTLDALARTHFPQLSADAGREAVTSLLDALDGPTLRQARHERQGGQAPAPHPPHNPLGLFPDRAALTLTAVVRVRRRGCVLLPGLDVFVGPHAGHVRLEAERPGMYPATGRDLLPVLQHLRALGYRLRRVRPRHRLPSDIVLEVRHPVWFPGEGA